MERVNAAGSTAAEVREIGVGIIGYGFIGKVHAFGYRTIPFHYDPAPVSARLVGVATSRPETAEKARAQGGFEFGTADWRRLMERKDIDIIHICSPNRLHAEQLLASIQAGKHVYCDKPLTATGEEAEGVERALPGWRGIGQMTFQYRFLPATMRARALVQEGFLGRVIGLRGVYLHSGSVDPAAPIRWKQRKSEGGGVLRDLGSHLLDLAEWLAEPIHGIFVENRILYPSRPDGRGRAETVEAEDQAVMTVRLASGAVGTLEVSKIATGAEDDLRLEIHGDRGALRFNLMEPDFLEAYSLSDPETPLGGSRGWKRISTIQRYGGAAVFPPPRATAGWLRGHVHCLYSFLCSVAEQKQAEPSLRRGIEVQRLLDSADRSARTRAWQKSGGL